MGRQDPDIDRPNRWVLYVLRWDRPWGMPWVTDDGDIDHDVAREALSTAKTIQGPAAILDYFWRLEPRDVAPELSAQRIVHPAMGQDIRPTLHEHRYGLMCFEVGAGADRGAIFCLPDEVPTLASWIVECRASLPYAVDLPAPEQRGQSWPQLRWTASGFAQHRRVLSTRSARALHQLALLLARPRIGGDA